MAISFYHNKLDLTSFKAKQNQIEDGVKSWSRIYLILVYKNH